MPDFGAGAEAIFGIETLHPTMRLALELGLSASETQYSVLIRGETGTGKELVARGIHRASRRSGPFVPVNCGAIPEALFEAELFGARRGAFTGLDRERQGLFAAAEGGTLFLDEVGELPLSTQAKLLRALEHSEILPLGGSTFQRTDVRVLAATNRDLRQLATVQRFRDDLLYRVAAVEILLPPLRERRHDIPSILARALADACAVQKRSLPEVEPAALAAILAYSWPGNVREFLNTIAAALLVSTKGCLKLAELPCTVQSSYPPPDRTNELHPAASFSTLFQELAACESTYLARVLASTNNNVSHAARIAGISRAALRVKARAHGLLAGGAECRAHRSRFRLVDSGR